MKAIKVWYVAGPIRAFNKDGHLNVFKVNMNCETASRVAMKYWVDGVSCAICPHMNTRNFDGHKSDNTWLEGDIEILRRCDGIVMVQGWENSAGSRAELDFAKGLGLEVIYDDGTEEKFSVFTSTGKKI